VDAVGAARVADEDQRPVDVALEGQGDEAAAHEVAALCAPPAKSEPQAAPDAIPAADGSQAGAPMPDCQLEQALELLRSRVSITRS